MSIICHRWLLTSDTIGRCQQWRMTDDGHKSLQYGCQQKRLWKSNNEIDWTIMWEMRANTLSLLIFLCILQIFLCKKNGLGTTSKTLFSIFLRQTSVLGTKRPPFVNLACGSMRKCVFWTCLMSIAFVCNGIMELLWGTLATTEIYFVYFPSTGNKLLWNTLSVGLWNSHLLHCEDRQPSKRLNNLVRRVS